MKKLLLKIKNLFKKSSKGLPAGRQGFTLIELLVVIGILGILASALVATIDPFEQLKKGQDANIKNATVEYLNANVRYYTTHNVFPWAAAPDGAGCNGAIAPDGTKTLTDASLVTCVTALVTEKELKSGFDTATNLTKNIYFGYDSTDNTPVACFQPQSKSQQNDLGTKYNHNGTTGTVPKVCTFNPDGTPTNIDGGCFWCTK